MNLGVLKGLNYASKYLKEDVIARGGRTDSLHIVLRGEVGLFLSYKKPAQKLIKKYGSGDFFGDAAFFLEQNSPYTSVALTDVITISVSRRTVADFMADEPGLAYELMKALAERAAQIDAELIKRAGAPWLELQAAAPTAVVSEPSVASARGANAPAVKSAVAGEAPIAPPEHVEFALFPEGHISHPLEMDVADTVHLMEKSYVCPVCKKSFKALRVKPSQLTIERTDKDMRNRYKGVEPLHYDVTTCPHCLFSALTDMFQKPDKPNAVPPQELKGLGADVHALFAAPRSPMAVFAGYYLALVCAPVYFMKHESATANLLLKLGRLYGDCEDTQMELATTQKALDAYLEVYMNLDLTPPQEQQLCVITAELYLKLCDVKNAKSYFFRAKTTEPGTPRLVDHAEMRLMDIQLLEIEEEKAAKQAEENTSGKKKK
ncbi:MAG: DUF2225 domain-containing protein [Clostridiaceae bacterium]|nr:DUF2225 domain-containing protein [Eubacteriales bacterium]